MGLVLELPYGIIFSQFVTLTLRNMPAWLPDYPLQPKLKTTR